MTESSRTYLYCFFMMITAIITCNALSYFKVCNITNPTFFLLGWAGMEFFKYAVTKIKEIKANATFTNNRDRQ